jgi:hypothetical protein
MEITQPVMKFEILSVRNGFKVKCLDYDNDGQNEIVVSENHHPCDDDPEDMELWRALLNEIIWSFGPSGSKYSAKRVRVVCLPGHSFEGDVSNEYYEEMKDLFRDVSGALRTINRHRRALKKNQE